MKIVVAEKRDVLKIPNAALRFRPSTGQAAGQAWDGSAGAVTGGGAIRPGPKRENRKTVWILEGKKVRPVEVRLGITDGTVSEVVEGDLREGQAVIVGTASQGQGRPGTPSNPRRFGF